MKRKVKLGVNIDHIATLRQARLEAYPDVFKAAKEAIAGGADSIVAHLREDRRHIQDKDIRDIRKLKCHFDMEMASTDEMVRIALKVRPDMVTLVPEKRRELTTEGGLDVKGNIQRLTKVVQKLEVKGIKVSLFIDPDPEQIKAASGTGATFIELHTGEYARDPSIKRFETIKKASVLASKLGLKVNAGHGLNYDNVKAIAKIGDIVELNIGFSIIAKCAFVGLRQAVKDMKRLLIAAIILATCSFTAYGVPSLDLPGQIITPEIMPEIMPKMITKEAVKPAIEQKATVESIPTAQVITPEIAPLSTEEIVPLWMPTSTVTFEMVTNEIVSPTVYEKKQQFYDVPDDHWASDSVNSLVKLGITQGYPDGTYRGTKNISRYETAIFISKLAHVKQTRAAVNEKLMGELQAEVQKLRYTVDLYKDLPGIKKPFYGQFISRLRVGNLAVANSASRLLNAPIGPVFDYRFIANFRHDVSQASYLRVGIDTMDGSISGGRDLLKEMFEAEAGVEAGPWGLNVTAGPGLIVHREGPNNIFPSEDNTVFLRPNNGFKISYGPGEFDSGIGYAATTVSTRGAATTNDLYGYIGYTFKNMFLGDLSLNYKGDVFTDSINGNSVSGESTINMYELSVQPSSRSKYYLKVGVSGGERNPHNLFMGIGTSINDFFRDGSSIGLYANKIGSDFYSYSTYPGILGVNMFNKLFVAGTYDVGMEMTQAVSRNLTFRMLGNIVTGSNGEYGKNHPNSNSTFEIDMDQGIFDKAVLSFIYRVYQQPSAATNPTSDMIGLGFRYNY